MRAAYDKPWGSPIWADVASPDPATSEKFYRALMGWDATAPAAEMGDYQSFTLDGGIISGLYPSGMSGGDGWLIHFKVADMDAALATIERLGGTAINGPHEVGPLGTTLVAADPAGIRFGLWQPGTHVGFTAENAPGAPCWYELHTERYDEALEFYGALFDWPWVAMDDGEEFRMSIAGDNPASAIAGVYDMTSGQPESTPARWEIYLAVADADAAADRVRAEGGTVIDGPFDTPYGRMFHALDSVGSPVTLVTQPGA